MAGAPTRRSEAALEARRLKKSRAAYGSWPYYWRLLQATVTVRAIHDTQSRTLSEVLVNVEIHDNLKPLMRCRPVHWQPMSPNLNGAISMGRQLIYQHHGPKCPYLVLRRAACQPECCDGTTSGFNTLSASCQIRVKIITGNW